MQKIKLLLVSIWLVYITIRRFTGYKWLFITILLIKLM